MRLALISTVTDRLDALGRGPLVALSYKPMPGPVAKPPLTKIAHAFPLWDEVTATAARELGWEAFWAQHPAGAGRFIRLDAVGYEQAIAAAQALSLTTRPHLPAGDRQAVAVLELAGGAWYATGLGGIDDAAMSAWLLRLGSYPGYFQPSARALAPELRAVVSGVRVVAARIG